MNSSVPAGRGSRQPASVVSDAAELTARVVKLLDLLKKGAERAGFSVDGVALLMKKDRSNFNKQMNAERRMTVDELAEFPDDALGEFGALLAELKGGYIVTRPAATREDAVRQLTAGLVALLNERGLPAKTGGQLRYQGEDRRRAVNQ